MGHQHERELQQSWQTGNRIAAERGKAHRLQEEVNRLRRVLHDIADSRPDQHMDIEKTPELTTWICETCRKASVGAYPSNAGAMTPGATEKPLP